MNDSIPFFLIFLGLALGFLLIRSILDALGLLWEKLTVKEHTIALHHRYGKFQSTLSPGRHSFFGKGHTFDVVDTRQKQLALHVQELNTAEGITIKATAVGFYSIVDPLKLASTTSDGTSAIYSLVQIALRDLMSGIEAEKVLSNTRTLGSALLEHVSEKSKELGIQFTQLTVRDIILPTEIKNALSEAWRAKKHSLAELEAARGKAAATRTLANSAKLYETNPALLQVRYLEALETAAQGMGNTFVIGMENDKALSFKQ